MSDLALALIAKEKEERTGILDLGNCGLSDFPKELFELTWLKELYVRDNTLHKIYNNKGKPNNFTITSLPKDFSKLINLEVFMIKGGYKHFFKVRDLTVMTDRKELRIKDVSVIANLKKLKKLKICNAELTDINPITQLTNLINIDFSDNKITDITPIKELKQLTKIDFSFNQITDITPIKELKQLTNVNFNYNKITDITSIKELKQLTDIYFGNNQITNITPIKELKQLTNTYFSSNKITDIISIKELKQLAQIDFSRNQITEITSVKELRQLTHINFGNNQITDITPIKELRHLAHINFWNNQITDIMPIKELRQLTHINFGNNQITNITPIKELKQLAQIDFSDNEITDIMPLKELKQLTQTCFGNNRIIDISPIKELKQLTDISFWKNKVPYPTDTLDDIEKLRAYFTDAEKGTTDKRQVKLIFLGDGCAGKSTLLNHLKDTTHTPTPIPLNERTEGIETDIWKDYFPNYTINVWDFGGQDVLHSTHRLFLGERALYVLVWCRRDKKKCMADETHPLTYWLDFIASYGSKSVVLLVENIIDNEFSDDVTLKELVKRYESKDIKLIPTHHRIDVLNGTYQIKTFKDTIKYSIEELQDSYPLEDYPENWYTLEQRLTEEGNYEKFIDYKEYLKIANEENISDPEALLRHFAHTGLIGYYPDLSNHIILQMDWILEAMYACLKLKDNPLKRTLGKLINKDFEKVWENYSPEERELFKAYMLKSDLLHKVNKELNREYEYLLPALFSNQSKRDKIIWEDKDQYTVVKFGFMFGAIMQQLQVRILNYCHTEDEETFYKNYISFTDRYNNNAYIEVFNEEKELRIYSENNKLQETILSEINRIYPLDRVSLFKREKRKEEETPLSFNDKKLSFEDENDKNENNMKPIKVFVTYCWTDKDGNMDEEHQKRVRSFVDFLREKGYEAEMDNMKTQEETATEFSVMMHEGINNYNKVIIILSEGYKKKAEASEGGVGKEYRYIIKDITKNKNKYILVSFDGIRDEITPFEFQDRDTIALQLDKGEEGNNPKLKELYAKLLDKKTLLFSDVENKLPDITPDPIPPLFANGDKNNKDQKD